MTITTAAQCRHRTTLPGPRRQTANSPTGLRLRQLAHAPIAVVSSVPKTAMSVPAIAFPSSAAIGLASCGPEAFGADATGFMAEGHEGARSRLHERGRAARIHKRPLASGPGDLAEELLVDPASVSLPSLGLLAGQRVADVDRTVGGNPRQLRR
jgi:hypothetical protein